MINVTPFLLFDGDCADAMAFYQACLGGELTIVRLGDTPMKEQMPPDRHARVAHAHLKNGAIELSATDWLHPTRKPVRGNMVAMYVVGGSHVELRQVFDRLREGADPALLDELREMPFGVYGHLADRFGVHWFFRGDRA